jgi:hypothetical protein
MVARERFQTGRAKGIRLMAFTSRLARIGVNACLVAASVAATLFVIEVSLRLAANPQLASRYHYWQQATYEGFLYHYASQPVELPPKNFHAVRGWTDFSIRHGPDGYLIEDVFGFPWRETRHVPYAKTRKRVILIGDSFIYGWNVARDETIDRLLSARLGDQFEVINLGTRGYGLDQMVLVANEVIPQLSPDDVVVGIIADDLKRSCQSTSFLSTEQVSATAKPRFEPIDGRLVWPPAVPTPYEMYLQHRERQTLDAVLARLYSVRILALAMGPFLQQAQETCIAKLNAALLRYLMNDTSKKTRIHLIHLDGVLPAEFTAEMVALKISYYNAPADIAATSQALGVTADRHPDGHPKAGLNAIYASMIYKILTSVSVAETANPGAAQ